MKKTNTILAVIFAILQILSAQTSSSDIKITAERLSEKITVDGILSESAWKRKGFAENYQEAPNEGKKPTQRSEMWFAYDDDAFYYAAKYYDSNPDSILARLVRRDFVWGDPSDGTVLYLDSYGDKRSGYFFYVNAAGTLADGLLENDSKQTDLSWDAVWEGVPHIDSDGWSVEMRIPFSQLRFKASETQIWGVNVERFISRRAETDMIAYTPRNESGFASRFPQLTGISGITPSTEFELLPYLTGKAEYVGNEPDNPFNPGHKYIPGFGMDIRFGLSNSLTVNATINPDFGQVEIDPANVNLSDVETAFDEKRPFFTEGVDIFRFGGGGLNNSMSFNWPGPRIFYSRRIGRAPQGRLPACDYYDVPNGTHIYGAAKVTGRIVDDWKIGTLHAVTKREFADISLNGLKSNIEVEPLSYYGVFRAQKDFNERKQGFGILSTYTDRFFEDESFKKYLNKDALVFGADGWTFFDNDRTYVISGWSAISRVSGDKEQMIAQQKNSRHYFQRPDANHVEVDSSLSSMFGHAGRFMINKNRGQVTANAAIGWLSPEFEVNDLGYGSYSDIINMHIGTGYKFNQPTSFYQSAGLTAATFASFDFGGNKTSQGFNLGSSFTTANLYSGNANMTYNMEAYSNRKTRGGPLMISPASLFYGINVNSDTREWWVLYLGGDRSFDSKNNYTGGYANVEFKLTPTLTTQVGPNISQSNSYAEFIGAFGDAAALDTYAKRYIFASLRQTVFSMDIRADWIIKPNLSFQAYFQPYLVSGKYNNFKALQKAKSYDFLIYGQDGSTIENLTTETGVIEGFSLDPDGDGAASPKIIGNPDFSYISLRGNAVLRWEYRSGSTLFLVWTQNRENIEPSGEFNFSRSMDNLANLRADNIFLLKATYWL